MSKVLWMYCKANRLFKMTKNIDEIVVDVTVQAIIVPVSVVVFCYN
jgi:hypothetical protein